MLNEYISAVYLLQDALPLFFFEVLLLDLEGAMQQLQFGGVSLQMHLGAFLISLPGKHCHETMTITTNYTLWSYQIRKSSDFIIIILY